MMKLLSVPNELLTIVCSQLHHTDILNLRQTCHTLERISRNRDAWIGVFRSFTQQPKTPKPFFLPKALADYTALELENVIRNWEAPWPDKIPTNVTRISVSKEDPGFNDAGCDKTSLAPGGRWLFLTTDNGSVCYLDLQAHTKGDVLPPKILIPPSDEGLESVDLEWISFDTDFSAPLTSHDYQLTEFRVATCLSFRSSSGSLVNRVNVWNIEVVRSEDGDNGAKKLQCRHLSTISAPRLIHCSLNLVGDHVAYLANFDTQWNDDGIYAMEIVDWTNPVGSLDPDGRDRDPETYGRWVIQLDTDSYVLDTGLLPEGRAAILFGAEYTEPRRIEIHDYVNSGRTTCDVDDFETPLPIWSFRDPGDSFYEQWEEPLPEPSLTVDGESRLLVKHTIGLHSLSIPPSVPRAQRPGALDIKRLSIDDEDAEPSDGISHHNRTVDLDKLRVYHHPPETPSEIRASYIDLDKKYLGLSDRSVSVVYDAFSNRVVSLQTSKSGTTLVILDFLV